MTASQKKFHGPGKHKPAPMTMTQAVIALRQALKLAEVKAGVYPTPEGWERERPQAARDVQKGHQALGALIGMVVRSEKKT